MNEDFRKILELMNECDFVDVTNTSSDTVNINIYGGPTIRLEKSGLIYTFKDERLNIEYTNIARLKSNLKVEMYSVPNGHKYLVPLGIVCPGKVSEILVPVAIYSLLLRLFSLVLNR